MKIKNILFVSDLDGTLLDKNQKVSLENQQAIKRFQDNGGLFTIATGRSVHAAKPIIDLLGIEIPVILYNGAMLYDPTSTHVIKEKVLEGYYELVHQLLSFASNHELGILLYQDGNIYHAGNKEIIEEYEQKDQVTSEQVISTIYNKPLTKILLISPIKDVLIRCESMVNSYKTEYELVYSESTYLEILPIGATKGNALLELVTYLKREELQTICVGDNLNDLSMLDVATRGFIVENAHDSLKEQKFELTVHHEGHAIAHMMDNYIFNS